MPAAETDILIETLIPELAHKSGAENHLVCRLHPVSLDVNLLGDFERNVNLNAKISVSAFG